MAYQRNGSMGILNGQRQHRIKVYKPKFTMDMWFNDVRRNQKTMLER